MTRKFHFNLCIQGDIMANETINFSLSVNPAAKPLTLVDANGNELHDGDNVALQDQTVGVESSQTVVVVSGGTPPYSFAVASGAVPDGDALNSTENADGSETVTLDGTPTTTGPATFALTVSDSAGTTAKVTAKKTIS
jgi:hypothetical protein